MTRTFKRGYVEKGWFNSITNKWVDDEYAATVSKIKQNDDLYYWEDEDEDEIDGVGGFATEEEAIEWMVSEHHIKELYNDDGLVWTKLNYTPSDD